MSLTVIEPILFLTAYVLKGKKPFATEVSITDILIEPEIWLTAVMTSLFTTHFYIV